MKDKKIFLVTLSPKTHRTAEENLGIEYLKASLEQKKYNVEIIDAWLNELEVEEVYNRIIKENNILFVGISSYMSNTEPTIELVNKLKKKNIKTVCGGFGPTFYPEEYLKSNADYILRGEGEASICELAECIEKNIEPINVKNAGCIKENKVIINPMRCLEENLDKLPFPSRDTLETVRKKKSTVNMVTSRGCSGNCDFCSVISFFRLSDGRIWRTRSIKNIVDEIEILHNQGIKFIKMVDDSFIDGIRNEDWCKEFADEIENRNIKVNLRGQIRADKITDTILKELRRAGFFSFACGIENGSQTALSRMNKTATLEENKKALELFKKYKYLLQMGFILFDKETTMKELEENYEFLNKYDFAVTKGIFSEMYSAEGTKLNSRLRKNKELVESDFINNNNKYTIDDILVAKVYSGLKKWHKSHSEIYDMTIDPLTAPKAIDKEYMEEFYKNTLELKKIDLMIFKDILLNVKTNENINIEEYINDMIQTTNNEYKIINQKVKKLYDKTGLRYNGIANPFI